MQSRAAKNAALDTVLPFPREPSRLYDLAQIEIAPALLLHRDALFRDNGRDEFRGRYIEARVVYTFQVFRGHHDGRLFLHSVAVDGERVKGTAHQTSLNGWPMFDRNADAGFGVK